MSASALISSSFTASGNGNIDISGLASRVDAVIDQTILEQRMVGAVVLISLDGKTIYSRAAGYADREDKKPMRENTLFRLASVSKQIISTSALVLVAQHRLNLDDTVIQWLPEFKPLLPNGESANITIRHLLTHTSGLSYGFLEPEDGPYHKAGVSDGMDDTNISLEENLRRLASVPLFFEPGKSWGYSLATDVLGAIISRVTDLPLNEAVRTLVTSRIGMNDTDFTVVDFERLAAAYVNEPSGSRRMADFEIIPLMEGIEGLRMSPARVLNKNAFYSAGAGMIGTANDLLLLLEVLRQGGEPLLPSALVQEMTIDHTVGIELAPWPGRGFGLGFTILNDPIAANMPETPGTWRMGGSYGHSWFVDPVEKLSVVAFTNASLEGQSPGGRIPHELCAAIYDRKP